MNKFRVSKISASILTLGLFSLSLHSNAQSEFVLQDNSEELFQKTNTGQIIENNANNNHLSNSEFTLANEEFVYQNNETNSEYDNTDILFFKTNSLFKPWNRLVQAKDVNYDELQTSVNNGTPIDYTMWEDNTMLIFGAMQNNIKHVTFALKNGAKLSKINQQGSNALHWASSHKDTSVLSLLLNKSTPETINQSNSLGQTPLHIASMNGNIESINLLLANGANVNALDKEGRNPAFYALSGRHYDSAKLLADKGANLTQKDKFEITPETLLVQKGSVDAYVMFFDKITKESKDKILFVVKDNPQYLHQLTNKDLTFKQFIDMETYGVEKNEEVI